MSSTDLLDDIECGHDAIFQHQSDTFASSHSVVAAGVTGVQDAQIGLAKTFIEPVSTQIEELNSILSGGLHAGNIVEVAGASISQAGKTVCLSTVVPHS